MILGPVTIIGMVMVQVKQARLIFNHRLSGVFDLLDASIADT